MKQALPKPTGASASLPSGAAGHAPAATRAVRILRLLAHSPAPLGVAAIAKDLGLNPSSCLHILRALVDEGLIAFDLQTKRYSLDAGILSLAGALLQEGSFYRAMQPALDRLARRFSATVLGLQPLARRHFVVVAMSRPEGALRLHVDVGSRFPLLISASGRCIAAFGPYEREDLRRMFSTLRWDSPPSFETWCKQVEATRRNGYGVDEGNYVRGVTIVAAPLFDPEGSLKYMFAATGITGQMERAGLAVIGEALIEAANETAQFLRRSAVADPK